MEQERRDSVKSLGKALQLIDIINRSRAPMTLMSLSQASGFPKSTVYALLNTLRGYDCIRQESDGRYYLGTRLFEWGCGVSSAWELNNVAHSYLEKLAAHTDATALLSRIEGSSVVVIDQYTAMCGGVYIATDIGTHLPLHATSQGKLLLAAMSDTSAKAFLNTVEPLEAFTPHTIVEQGEILRELRQIRADNYAVENGEYKIGMRSVSAPIYDRNGTMSYALSVVGLFRRVHSQEFEDAIAYVSATARQLSETIGYRGYRMAAWGKDAKK